MNNRKVRQITEDDLEKMRKNGFLTVGRLKKHLESLPDDGLVFTQRVEDQYYEGVDISGIRGCPYTEDGIFPEGSKSLGWSVLLKEGDSFQRALSYNEAIMGNEYEEGLQPISEEDLEASKVQYSPAWCCVKYSDDSRNVFIDLHY